MKEFKIKRYQSEDYSLWNEFVRQAKNATFLFHRDFMEYHADRFEDFSLLVFNEKNQLVAMMPAHIVGNEVFSHFGLTYGGIVISNKTKLSHFIKICEAIFAFLDQYQVVKAHFKTLPDIYASLPNQELLYVLFLIKAQLTRRDSLSVLNLQNNFKLSLHRNQSANRGFKNGLIVKEEPDFEAFWNDILIPNLKNKRQAKPVHSLAEIEYLHSKFPSNIRQFNVYHENKIVAGTTIFETENVAHPQYISGNSDKNALGSLDFLYRHLIENVFAHKKYFDFGPSNEQSGQKIGFGMQFWKESFDSHTVTQDFYTLETKNHDVLKQVLL